MDLDLTDTIVAPATARQGALRGVLRISGPQTLECLERCFSGPQPWRHSRRAGCWSAALTIEPSGSYPPRSLPGTLYLWPGRASFTRQVMAEFHTLGSLPLLDAAVTTLCQLGARLARPGEFTLRAFLAGRLDLTQAEAVLGVIDADNRSQLDTALVQLAGGMSEPLSRLRDSLLNLLADLEAGLDFADEDLEFVSHDVVAERIREADHAVAEMLERLAGRAEAKSIDTLVLYGRPNVGKSTLWNALTDSGTALVSDQAGTTRDYLIGSMRCGDRTLWLVDTAGTADPDQFDPVSHPAQRQSRGVSRAARLKVLCLDATRPPDDWERSQLESLDTSRLVVLNKIDQVSRPPADIRADLLISARDDADIQRLRQLLIRRWETCGSLEGSVVASTALRCRESLQHARHALSHALDLTLSRRGEELIAAALRHALDELGLVVGAVYTDDLLDRIFTRFCIGK